MKEQEGEKEQRAVVEEEGAGGKKGTDNSSKRRRSRCISGRMSRLSRSTGRRRGKSTTGKQSGGKFQKNRRERERRSRKLKVAGADVRRNSCTNAIFSKKALEIQLGLNCMKTRRELIKHTAGPRLPPFYTVWTSSVLSLPSKASVSIIRSFFPIFCLK